MRSKFIIIILGLLLSFTACKKDQEIADLENEVIEAESAGMMTGDSAKAVVDTTISTETTAVTPNVTPKETAPIKTMPIRNDFSGFTVQVAAGTDYNNTADLVSKYEERGYEAFVTEADIDGTLFYRVRIGTFETFDEANRLGLELKDRYSIAYWIDNN